MDRMTIHGMVPEDPNYLTELVRATLRLPYEQQVTIWRELRRSVFEGEFSLYSYELWLHDMAIATGSLLAPMPEEIVQDLKSGKLTPLLCELPLLNSTNF